MSHNSAVTAQTSNPVTWGYESDSTTTGKTLLAGSNESDQFQLILRRNRNPVRKVRLNVTLKPSGILSLNPNTHHKPQNDRVESGVLQDNTVFGPTVYAHPDAATHPQNVGVFLGARLAEPSTDPSIAPGPVPRSYYVKPSKARQAGEVRCGVELDNYGDDVKGTNWDENAGLIWPQQITITDLGPDTGATSAHFYIVSDRYPHGMMGDQIKYRLFMSKAGKGPTNKFHFNNNEDGTLFDTEFVEYDGDDWRRADQVGRTVNVNSISGNTPVPQRVGFNLERAYWEGRNYWQEENRVYRWAKGEDERVHWITFHWWWDGDGGTMSDHNKPRICPVKVIVRRDCTTCAAVAHGESPIETAAPDESPTETTLPPEPPTPTVYALIPSDAGYNSNKLRDMRSAAVQARVRFESVTAMKAEIIAYSNKGLPVNLHNDHTVFPRFFDSDPRESGFVSCMNRSVGHGTCTNETRNNGGKRWALLRVAEMTR